MKSLLAPFRQPLHARQLQALVKFPERIFTTTMNPDKAHAWKKTNELSKICWKVQPKQKFQTNQFAPMWRMVPSSSFWVAIRPDFKEHTTILIRWTGQTETRKVVNWILTSQMITSLQNNEMAFLLMQQMSSRNAADSTADDDDRLAGITVRKQRQKAHIQRLNQTWVQVDFPNTESTSTHRHQFLQDNSHDTIWKQ